MAEESRWKVSLSRLHEVVRRHGSNIWEMRQRIWRIATRIILFFCAIIVFVGFLAIQTSEHGQFLAAVFNQWVQLMSGIASVILAVTEAKAESKIPKRLFWLAAAFCIFGAFEQIWVAEHRATEGEKNKKRAVEQKLDKCQSNIDAKTNEVTFCQQNNQSQQSTVYKCLDFLMKTNSPQPLSIATAFMTSDQIKDNATPAKRIDVVIGVPSENVGRLRVVVECDQPFSLVESKISSPYNPGAGMMELGIGTEWINPRRVALASSAKWGPNQPLVVVVSGDNLRRCQITEQK